MPFKWNWPLPDFWNRTCETGFPCLLAELQSLIRAEGVSPQVCGWLCGSVGLQAGTTRRAVTTRALKRAAGSTLFSLQETDRGKLPGTHASKCRARIQAQAV